MSLTPREWRQKTRDDRSLVREVCDAHKGLTETRDEYIEYLKGHSELQKQALDQAHQVISVHKKRGAEREQANRAVIDHQTKMIDDLSKIVDIQRKILEANGLSSGSGLSEVLV